MSFLKYQEALGVFDGALPSVNTLFSRLSEPAYREGFANPAYAKQRLGEWGGILSMFYADLFALPAWDAQGRQGEAGQMRRLLSRVLGMTSAREAGEAVLAVYRDLGIALVGHGIEAMVDPGADSSVFFRRMVMESDLSNTDYLSDYGVPISENELGLSRYLAKQDPKTIRSMAETFACGYRDGFAATQKDIGIKSTVKVEYPVGFERVVREAVKLFAKMGLQATFVREAMTSMEGRSTARRGVYTTAINRQFLYDHREDRAYYFDEDYASRRIGAMEAAFEKHRTLAQKHGGPAVIEIFGEETFSPRNQQENAGYSDEQNRILVSMLNRAGQVTNRYIPGEERSFTIIAFPLPSIGSRFEEIFHATIGLNTLDSAKYRKMQQQIIDVLDRGRCVRILGAGGNETDMTVMLHPLEDASTQTNFENCVADVNIPVGEVFTSPVLEGTFGTLHVSRVYLGDYEFRNLKLRFEEGMVREADCDNFRDPEENQRLISERILFKHESLPIGEFAIGTNTRAYRMARDFDIAGKLPILIAEKTGPHFAVGDTCYSHAEDVPMFNPDGKECIARDNSVSILRKSEPDKAYFNCHTDITIPFEELGRICAVDEEGREYDIIREGRFVVPGTYELNEPLE